MSMWTDLSRTAHAILFVDVGTWRTRVLEAGSGPALLLMHGSGGHLEAYTRNVAALARHRRVVAFDFPGHGFTSLASADLEMPDYVTHALGLLDALDIGQADVSGESLGGWVAMALASRHPDRVGRMVLNTPGGTMCDPAVMERIRGLSQDAADDPSEERIRARLAWLMADPSSVTDELVRVRREIYAQPGFAGSMRHILCLQGEAVRRRNMISDDELRGIKAPTRVIWTSDDPSGPVAEGKRITGLLPEGDFQLIEDAGHWPQWEQPDEFNELVTSFLDSRT
jgi:2-hydroxy-6-oxonona-2,4-dienedioate hydrolase